MEQTDAGSPNWGPLEGRELAVQFLELLNCESGFRETIGRVLELVKEHIGFEAVGIRLREGEDFPYYVTSGLPAGLRVAERSLCVATPGGEIARHADGAPVLECLCGLVISGQTDASLPWFTPAGSFWSNHAAETASTMSADEIPTGFPGRCLKQGFQSLALIPLRHNEEIIGLLQLCDRRPDRVTLQMVGLLERLGTSVGICIRKQQGEQFPGQIVYAPIINEQGQTTRLMGDCRSLEWQKRADAESELMARVFEETREGVALADLDGNLFKVNEAFAAMHGYRPAELVGENLSVFHLPEQMPAVEAAVRQTVEAGHFDGEIWHARRDGTPFPALMHNKLLRDEKGEPKCMIGTMVDISERRRLEERYRTFIANSMQGIWFYKIDPPLPTDIPVAEQVEWMLKHAVVEDCNEAYAKANGFSSADELLGLRHTEVLGGNESAAKETIRTWVEGGYGFEGGELKQSLANGKEFWALVTGASVFEKGRVVRTWGTLIDITDRRLAEDQLREALDKLKESETHLKRAQQVSSMGSWHWKVEPDEFQWSDEIFRIFGVEPGAFSPSLAAILARTHPEDQLFVRQRVADILEDQESGGFDLRILRPSGEVRHLHARGEVTRDARGTAVSVVGTTIDITERKNAEEMLQRAQRLSAIGTLAAGVAHEINNPVGSAMLAAETALAMKNIAGKEHLVDQSLREVVQSLERCGAIVRNVLKFSCDGESERWRIQVNDVVRRAADHVRPYATRFGAEVEVNLAADLPEIEGNPLELELALANVLRNAVDAGSQPKPIRVNTRHSEDGVRITIQDWGPGMSAEVRERLFDPFFTTRLNKGGMGLGAGIAYGIVKSHNGAISVGSRPNEGTLVSISLPIADDLPE